MVDQAENLNYINVNFDEFENVELYTKSTWNVIIPLSVPKRKIHL